MENEIVEIREHKGTTFSEFLVHINNHSAINHPLFSYLKDCAKKGFTAKQYQIYRDNYFFRTLYTIPSIAALVTAAALNADNENLAIAGQNLYEETGSSNPLKTHSKLLEFSHNTHGKIVFNLEPITLTSIQNENSILKEARLFVECEKNLYNSNFYCTVLGANFAHETAAVPMLTNFYESFFLSYKKYYTNKNFSEMSEYFQAHLTGLEQQHANNAQFIAEKACKNQENLNHLIEGGLGFLKIQSCLWDGLYREISKAQHEGKRIPIDPENF